MFSPSFVWLGFSIVVKHFFEHGLGFNGLPSHRCGYVQFDLSNHKWEPRVSASAIVMHTIQDKISSLSASDLAAWWGAILATLVFFWELYKWCHTGPRLKVRTTTDMQICDAEGRPKPQKFVFVTVVNVGDSPTTLTHLGLDHYKSRFRRIVKRVSRRMVIPQPGFAQAFPKLLGIGERWTGTFEQTNDINEMIANGLLYCGVRDESTDTTTYTRVLRK